MKKRERKSITSDFANETNERDFGNFPIIRARRKNGKKYDIYNKIHDYLSIDSIEGRAENPFE